MGLASVGFHRDLCAEATPNQWFRFEILVFRSVPNQVLLPNQVLPMVRSTFGIGPVPPGVRRTCRVLPRATRAARALAPSHCNAIDLHSRVRKNHPRQSPTIDPCCPYIPVFSSPTATLEVVGNTGNMSSEKAALYHFPSSRRTRRSMSLERGQHRGRQHYGALRRVSTTLRHKCTEFIEF
jgi:hypothetical protein